MAVYNGREVTVLSTDDTPHGPRMATISSKDYGNQVVKLSDVKFTVAEKQKYKSTLVNTVDHLTEISDKDVQELRDGQDPKKAGKKETVTPVTPVKEIK